MQHLITAYQFHIRTPFSFRCSGSSENHFPAVSSSGTSREYYLILVTQNGLRLHTSSFSLTAASGEYLLLPADAWNSFLFSLPPSGHALSGPHAFYWVCLSCPSVFPDPDGRSAPCDAPDLICIPSRGTLFHPQKVFLLIRQLQSCVRSGYEHHYLDYLSTLVLCEIFHQQQFMRGKKGGIPELPAAKKQLYREILDYISRFISSDLKVSAIARHFGYNEKYLSRYFKEISGISLKQYILNQKIERANFLLADSSLTVSNISRALGFSDYHNFIRVYKSITSMTPTEYRNIYLGGTESRRRRSALPPGPCSEKES